MTPISTTNTDLIRVNALERLLCHSESLGAVTGYRIAATSAGLPTECRKTALGVARGRVAALIAELERADAILSAEIGAVAAQEHGDLYDS